MITAVGTAVTIVFEDEKQSKTISGHVTSTMLVNEMAKRKILEKINDDEVFLTLNMWDEILQNPGNDYTKPLLRRYINVVTNIYMAYRTTG